MQSLARERTQVDSTSLPKRIDMVTMDEGFAAEVRKALEATGYEVFLDASKDQRRRAVKFMAEKFSEDGKRSVTCVVAFVTEWSLTMIWAPSTAVQKSITPIHFIPEFQAAIEAPWQMASK